MITRGIDQSDADAIQERAAHDVAYRASAIEYLTQVGAGLDSTAMLSGSEGLTGASVGGLVATLSAMSGQTQPLTPDAYRQLPSPNAANTSAPTTGALADNGGAVDPNAFHVQGSKQGDGSYWFGNPMVGLVRSICDRQRHCSVTDRVTVKMTITPTRAKTVPGRSLGSVIAWSALWAPNQGHFYQVHMDAWGISRGSVMFWSNPGTSGDLAYPSRMHGTYYAKNDHGLAGSVLTVAPDIWANSQDGWKMLGTKTADCKGRTGRDVRCFY